ncbi:aminotransferase class I/II-fold pyridoxal phosphate-dependent enzyme [Clostridium sp. SYSU_GA19001]|uniref:aminotransferase class I/II-fold pyridoxal phosphate-dependent enzyme n=1 Tax=Clostridium caldaquaticum TaxID=2940653 RepID=UPI0020770824|nr:aminotransferase class I/II-fold pyridoxal phosphate-dependent enzyme [Clostridium caldaquaticum]MCM8710561.1 aminotransferase class I/II-fold pyridoxal phosphate-dependent enzyme [Clostridium caldaquaticum]
MKPNNRLKTISEYHFQKLDIIKKNMLNDGKKIIDLSIGDPDLPVENSIINALIEGLKIKDFNKYPPYEGIQQLKKGIIKYYEQVFSVKLEFEEVLILIGSKEGINNIVPAVCDIGDYAIIPKPAYPVYETSCHLWGVNAFEIPLLEKNLYLPEVKFIPKDILPKSKLFVLNYPNNPTGAVANSEFYKEIIEFCIKNDIVLYNDGAYNEIIKEGEAPLSLLQIDKKKQCIEFGTFSKIYNMTGFRIGYAVGNSQIIKALLKVKSNVDSGQFIPIQYAAIQALKLTRNYVDNIRKIFDERRQNAEQVLTEHNIDFFKSVGTFYIWCKTPAGYTTETFCEELLNNYGIIVTPGIAFGDLGKDYFRIALTKDKQEIVQAFSNLKVY